MIRALIARDRFFYPFYFGYFIIFKTRFVFGRRCVTVLKNGQTVFPSPPCHYKTCLLSPQNDPWAGVAPKLLDIHMLLGHKKFGWVEQAEEQRGGEGDF